MCRVHVVGRPEREWARAAAAIVAAAGVALSAAACGGSTATKRSAASAQDNGAVAFAHCMRTHAVPSWPDPDSGGRFDKSKLTSRRLGASSARVQAAQSACRHLLPNGGQPSQAASQQFIALALRFSRCVRSHGVTNFPDPGGGGRIPDPASLGIDQGSPRFQAANRACGRYRPPYIPSNSAYDSYARTHTGGA